MVFCLFSRIVPEPGQGRESGVCSGIPLVETPGYNPGRSRRCRCRGSVATLIELLVVLAIIAFLASSYLLPHNRGTAQENVSGISPADPVATVEAARRAAAQVQQTQTKINRELDNALK